MEKKYGQRSQVCANPETFKKALEILKAKMMIPVRCWSCGKPIGHLWEEYQARLKKGEDGKKVMDSLGLDRYCCRAQIMGTVELIDTAAQFKKF